MFDEFNRGNDEHRNQGPIRFVSIALGQMFAENEFPQFSCDGDKYVKLGEYQKESERVHIDGAFLDNGTTRCVEI